jgi:NitT/TauT family transport system permease protein
MTTFISKIKKIAVVVFWLLVWEIAARITANTIILVGPVDAFGRLFALAATGDFWLSINYSLVRILLGFALSLCAGVLLAIICAASKLCNALITPLINVAKSIPVVSFALLAMMWLSPAWLSVFVAFITVLPIIFFNTFTGIENTDRNLLQMANVFRVSIYKKVRYIYIPTVAPFLASAAESGLGFAWKAAIAGEVISMGARNTIGGSMHVARTFLQTADLFAWTIAIVVLSFLMEKAFFKLFGRVKKWQ